MSDRMFRKLVKAMLVIIVMLTIIALIGLCTLLVVVSLNNKIEGENEKIVYESIDHNTVVPPATTLPEVPEVKETKEEKYNRGLSEYDKYLLAKIAMAEAEGESLKTKILVIFVVLNRVESNQAYFPDTIEEVIFQSNKGVYQFSPVMEGGRWWTTEPNDECWEAVNIVNEMAEDISCGALYFEACKGESWHSRNLEFICQSDNTRFYK